MEKNKHLLVDNVKIYGLENAIRVAKFPMAADTSVLNCEKNKVTDKLASCAPSTAHNNFLNGIIVQFDLTFTNKAWIEAERYHWFEIQSSQSTMHRITKFNLDESYVKYVDKRSINIIKELVEEYNSLDNKTSEEAKELYLRIIYSNPIGMLLTAGMTTNYLQLKTIYAQRKNHRLPEWRDFCKWIKTLPESNWITGGE
jgi:hypothetical protein